MSDEGSYDDGAEGLLPEADVLNLMRRMTDMNLPVSTEEIQVGLLVGFFKCYQNMILKNPRGHFHKQIYVF